MEIDRIENQMLILMVQDVGCGAWLSYLFKSIIALDPNL